MSELPPKMGASPVVVLNERKGRSEGLGEGESASKGESSPFSSFHPMPSPRENYELWQKTMLILNTLSLFGVNCGFAHLNKIMNVYMLR